MLQEPRTLGRLLKQRITKSPDKYAIGWIENNEVKNMTFMDYKNQIEVLVGAFQKIGISVGDKIAIIGVTSKEWHLLDMATLCSRSALVPIYHSYLGPEIHHLFTHSDSSVIIVENDQQLEKIIPYLGQWELLKLIISIQDVSSDLQEKVQAFCPLYSYKDLVKLGLEEIHYHPDLLEKHIHAQSPEEIASIIYTSGTTGEPKGAVITHHALVSMLMNVEKSIKGSFTYNDRTLTFLPLSHVLGRCDSFLPLVFGWQSVYAESLEKILDNIQIVQPTIMLAVPRIFEKIYSKVQEHLHEEGTFKKQVLKWALSAAEKYFSKIDRDLSPTAFEILEYSLAYKVVFSKIYQQFGGRIRYFVSGGAPLSPEIFQFLRFANLTILEGYGLTETIAPCCLNPLTKQVAGTVGRPMGDVEISFASDGEILIRTEAMMKEYYKNPEATSKALQDGKLHTGDIGEFTAEGHLKITDRKKDLIITSGGKNVAPQKIENMAKNYPHISQVVVIGDQRPYLTALIGIDKEDFLPMLEELGLPTDCSIHDLANHPQVIETIRKEVAQLNQQLPKFETVKNFRIIPEPFSTENFLTPTLKVKRSRVTAQFQELVEAMYQ